MTDNVPIVKRAKLLTSGTSTLVAVPAQWIKDQGLAPGDDIILVANGNLTIMKSDKENIQRLRNQLSDHEHPTLKGDEK